MRLPFPMVAGPNTISDSVAQKIVDLIRRNNGKAPAKISLVSCVTGRSLPGVGCFAGNLALALHKKGIDTVVSASTRKC